LNAYSFDEMLRGNQGFYMIPRQERHQLQRKVAEMVIACAMQRASEPDWDKPYTMLTLRLDEKWWAHPDKLEGWKPVLVVDCWTVSPYCLTMNLIWNPWVGTNA